ncbi:14803_t:CDS:2 [Acaulospora morrowiae]|uniref:14803_t:CDS:1 n=1 Tax=Acaulospora morrowiae TaxID=94023 RepID=A0A9N8WA26_9GLOM|nr:14803_t:CDS:2 [Acaulospora morrowiae]
MNSEVTKYHEQVDDVKPIETANENQDAVVKSSIAEDTSGVGSKVRLLILIGVPGSGKSTLAKNICKIYPDNWYRVNQDDLGSRQACEDLARAKLKEGKNVIVDRVNFDKNQRKTWIEIAWKFDVPVDAIIMDTSMEECSTRINMRENHPTEVQGQKGIEILGKFREWMKLPEHREGIERIIRVKPQPTVDSYNKQVIDEILFRLDNETAVRHDRSVGVNKLEIHAGRHNSSGNAPRNYRGGSNSRGRYNTRGGTIRRGGYNGEPAYYYANTNAWSK